MSSMPPRRKPSADTPAASMFPAAMSVRRRMKGVRPVQKHGDAVEEEARSIADAIMEKRRMAKGGEVGHDTPLDESNYDERNEDMAEQEHDLDWPNGPEVSQPEDSNEHGRTLEDADEDGEDLISRIRARLKSSTTR